MKSRALAGMVWAVGLLVPVAVAATPGEAEACGMAVRLAARKPDLDKAKTPAETPKPVLVASAEEALGAGKLAKAAAMTAQVFPGLKTMKVGTQPLADRALRILALATVRSEGAVEAAGLSGKTPAERAASLRWAVATLRDLNAQRINNPSYQTDLGEALSHVPAQHAEALALLSGLADKDLLTTAEGYAALARLRAENGDAPAREAAVKRCTTMAKDPKVCDVPGAAPAASRT